MRVNGKMKRRHLYPHYSLEHSSLRWIPHLNLKWWASNYVSVCISKLHSLTFDQWRIWDTVVNSYERDGNWNLHVGLCSDYRQIKFVFQIRSIRQTICTVICKWSYWICVSRHHRLICIGCYGNVIGISNYVRRWCGFPTWKHEKCVE